MFHRRCMTLMGNISCYLRPVMHSTFAIEVPPFSKHFLELKAGPPPPFEAILVIFYRRALSFFLFESSWKKMKNDTTFVRMRSGDHLGDAKMSKRAPRSVELLNFINCDRQKRFSQNERRRADLHVASDFLICLGT